jgi:transposase
MARRPPLSLADEMRAQLTTISRSRTESAARVRRAQILLAYSDGKRITDIAREMATTRPLVERVIDKALAFDALQALKDLPRPGRAPKVSDDAKSWVLSVACRKPKELGYAHESWTYSLLAEHIRTHCEAAGYPALAQLGKGRLHELLAKSNIKPHKISYYLERKDPEFDAKMANVLCVYKEVQLQNASATERRLATVSYDEKPGIQALAGIAADLAPVPQLYQAVARDYEYKRLGTVSLLAGIDLHTGRVVPLVRDRHRSREFIEFLHLLDERYPEHWKIRLVLDNHSSHVSKETQRYLLTCPGRFEFVFTPKHGSWLNLIEMFFSKIARSFLRHIRVASKEELIERIYQGIEAMNQEPVVFRWRYKMDEIAVA